MKHRKPKPRELKVCPDCGHRYRNFEAHKNGSTKQCDSNQALDSVKPLQEALRAARFTYAAPHTMLFRNLPEGLSSEIVRTEKTAFNGWGNPVPQDWVPIWLKKVATQMSLTSETRKELIRLLWIDEEFFHQYYSPEFQATLAASLALGGLGGKAQIIKVAIDSYKSSGRLLED